MLDKIFVINSGQTKNVSDILAVLTSMDIQFPIQIMKNMPKEKIDQYINNKLNDPIVTKKDITDNITYCKIWSEAIKQNLQQILVIEDNCEIRPESMIKLLSEKYTGIVYLGHAYVFDLAPMLKLYASDLTNSVQPLRDWLPRTKLNITKRNLFGSKSIRIVTVASDPTDGYGRFVDSCKFYDWAYVVLGMGQPWSWDLTVAPGGGKKVNLLKRYLDNCDLDDDQLILFSDSYDVILNDCPESVVDKFNKFGLDALFSSETLIWPDKSLEAKFPRCSNSSPYIYLNSGGFISSVGVLKQLVSEPIDDSADDQLYYQRIFLNNLTEKKFKIELDYECEIFQTLSARFTDIKIDYAKCKVTNALFPTNPSVLHGNGGVQSKMFLNSLGNYIPNNTYANSQIKNFLMEPTQTILFLVHINKAFKSNLLNLFKQNYPQNLCKYVFYGYGAAPVENIIYEQVESGSAVRDFLIKIMSQNQSDYYFLADTSHMITDPNIMRKLIGSQKDIISPVLLSEQNTLFSNFWGDVDSNGFYKRSADYLDIVQYRKKGIWNVPYVCSSILISKNRIGDVLKELRANNITNEDFDMYFSRILRKKYIFLNVTNWEVYGKILD